MRGRLGDVGEEMMVHGEGEGWAEEENAFGGQLGAYRRSRGADIGY